MSKEDPAMANDNNLMASSSLGCDSAVHDLYHFLDGQLTDEKRALIAQHLDQCAPCGSAAHFEEELRKVIADRCTEQVPQSLIERVGRAIDEESRHAS